MEEFVSFVCRAVCDWRLFVLIRVRLFQPFFHFIAHRRHPIVLSPVYMDVNRLLNHYILSLSRSLGWSFACCIAAAAAAAATVMTAVAHVPHICVSGHKKLFHIDSVGILSACRQQ